MSKESFKRQIEKQKAELDKAVEASDSNDVKTMNKKLIYYHNYSIVNLS